MKSLYTLVLALSGVTMAVPACAELVGAEVGLSYGVLNADALDENLTGVRVHGLVDYAATPNFGLQAGAAFDRFSYDDGTVDADLELNSFDAHAYYKFGAGRVGAFIGRIDAGDLSAAGLGTVDLDQQLTTYGLEGDYDFGPLTVGAHFGVAEVEDVDEVDTRFFGVDSANAITDNFAVLTTFDWTEFEAGGDSTTLTNVALGLEYYVTPNLAVTGSIGHTVLDNGFDSEEGFNYGIGVTYAFEGTANRSRPFGSLTLPF